MRCVNETSNFAFILHNVCGLVLLAIGIVLGLNQYFRSSIYCFGRDDVPTEYANTICIGKTFIYLDSLEKKPGVEVPYPGIDKHTPQANLMYQPHYRWVPYVIILQSFWFLIIYLIWAHAITRNSLSGLMDHKDLRRVKIRLEKSLNKNWLFAVRYSLLNLMLVIHFTLQMVYLDDFLDGRLKSVIYDSETDEIMSRNNFPRIASCKFNRFGASGDVQRHDLMCSLPLSDLFVKAIRFDYFFLYFGRIVSIIALIYYFFLSLPFLPQLYAYLMPSVRSTELSSLARACFVGDWLVVTMVMKRLGVHRFNEMLESNEANEEQLPKHNERQRNNYPTQTM